MSKRPGRIIIVAPMRAHCETVKNIFLNAEKFETFLSKHQENDLLDIIELDETFGLVGGTGIGKTAFIKDICAWHFGENFDFDIVTRDEEATAATWKCPVLVVTVGIALNWFKSGEIRDEDILIFDEIHLTSAQAELCLALAKHRGMKVNWLSATVDHEVYAEYLQTDKVIVVNSFDKSKKAEVKSYQFSYRYSYNPDIISTREPWIDYLMSKTSFLDQVKEGKRGVAVFLPTRAQCEEMATKYRSDEIYTDFYHGGELATKLQDFILGNVPKPFIIFMTTAGSSSLNLSGLDTVVIIDSIWNERISISGTKMLDRGMLGSNEIIQMMGRVNGRVANGQVIFLSERTIDFENLRLESPKFVLGGNIENLVMILAKMRINFEDISLITKIDKVQYDAALRLLKTRKLIEPSNRLTKYGEAVIKLPTSRVWAEHIVKASDTLEPIVTMIAACPSIEAMIKNKDDGMEWGEFLVENNDFLTKYNIVKEFLYGFVRMKHSASGREVQFFGDYFGWCKEKNLHPKQIQEAVLGLNAICRALDIDLQDAIDGMQFPDLTPGLIKEFEVLMVKVGAMTVADYRHLDGFTIYGNNRLGVAKKFPKIGISSVFRGIHMLEGVSLSDEVMLECAERVLFLEYSYSFKTYEYQILLFGRDFARITTEKPLVESDTPKPVVKPVPDLNAKPAFTPVVFPTMERKANEQEARVAFAKAILETPSVFLTQKEILYVMQSWRMLKQNDKEKKMFYFLARYGIYNKESFDLARKRGVISIFA
ncbi:MAG: helicase-related protein [Patescibacteria group bacterium]